MSAQQQVGIVGVFSDAACTTEVAPGYGSLNQVVTIGQCTTITLGGYPAGSGILTSNGASRPGIDAVVMTTSAAAT